MSGARRHDDQMLLVLDQRLDRADERAVKLMREAEIEQLASACGRAFRALQAALLSLRLRALRRFSPRLRASTSRPWRKAATFSDSDLAPSGIVFHAKSLPVTAKVAFVISHQKEDERFVLFEKPLHLAGHERLRACDRGVVREFLFQASGCGRNAAFDICDSRRMASMVSGVAGRLASTPQ